jgi:2-polyprenyl-6-methoxyphenol hydroxylase-like FAD-dependent oxidoreductase
MTRATDEQLDALVVGAGPTGLTLAAQLQGFGATFRIIDRQLDRVHESRALAVQPRTLEVLRGLAVAEELVARGNDTVRVQLHAGSRVVPVRLFGLGLTDTAYPFLLFVSQAETEAILNDHLVARSAGVERGVELVDFTANADDVMCTLRHRDGRTEQVRTRYLVGCDGAHSSVRRGAGIRFAGGAYPQTFTLADLEVDGGLERDSAHAYLGQPGSCSSSRWGGLRPGGCLACRLRFAAASSRRHSLPSRSSRSCRTPSPAASFGCATRSG